MTIRLDSRRGIGENKMKRMGGALVIVLLFLTGCGVTIKQSSRGMLPVIPEVARPTLVGLTEDEAAKAKQIDQGLLDKVNENFKRMHMYSVQLETGVKKYNEYAEKNNELVREENGLPDLSKEEKSTVEKKEK
jgi:hypothetical protein